MLEEKSERSVVTHLTPSQQSAIAQFYCHDSHLLYTCKQRYILNDCVLFQFCNFIEPYPYWNLMLLLFAQYSQCVFTIHRALPLLLLTGQNKAYSNYRSFIYPLCLYSVITCGFAFCGGYFMLLLNFLLMMFLHGSRNVQQALTRMLLDLIDHFVKFVLLTSFLIVLFIFQSEVDFTYKWMIN